MIVMKKKSRDDVKLVGVPDLRHLVTGEEALVTRAFVDWARRELEVEKRAGKARRVAESLGKNEAELSRLWRAVGSSHELVIPITKILRDASLRHQVLGTGIKPSQEIPVDDLEEVMTGQKDTAATELDDRGKSLLWRLLKVIDPIVKYKLDWVKTFVLPIVVSASPDLIERVLPKLELMARSAEMDAQSESEFKLDVEDYFGTKK